MSSYNFETLTHGKWILAGEHAVLRGHGALVFPLKTHQFSLNYLAEEKFSIEALGENSQILNSLFLQALQHGKKLLAYDKPSAGKFILSSNLPLGRGLGASAALCLALARWFTAQQLVESNSTLNFAQNLEHLFHGQSSGLDIIGAASTHGVYFQKGETRNVAQQWQPFLFLSFCGEQSSTVDCIRKVKKLWERDATKGKKIDLKMSNAVEIINSALESANLNALQEGIKASAECFKSWGLISPRLDEHMNDLIANGALAVKPTGSGGGGYLLSLWEDDSKLADSRFIPLF